LSPTRPRQLMRSTLCWRRWLAPVALFVLSFSARAALAQTGTVTGKVTSETGDPVAGVRIVIIGTTPEAHTANAGTFRITNVPSGRVVVRAFRLGFKSAIDTTSLTPGGAIT